VGILKKGAISLNAAAMGALGMPDAVQLLYNPRERIVGIRAIGREQASAHKVNVQAGSSYIVYCGAFLQFYGLEHDQGRQYAAKLVGSILQVDLSAAQS